LIWQVKPLAKRWINASSDARILVTRNACYVTSSMLLIFVTLEGADIINMSYGEPAARPDVGRAIEVATEAVNKAGVIFVASAGNAGRRKQQWCQVSSTSGCTASGGCTDAVHSQLMDKKCLLHC
jgi:subtilisin family serine protease